LDKLSFYYNWRSLKMKQQQQQQKTTKKPKLAQVLSLVGFLRKGLIAQAGLEFVLSCLFLSSPGIIDMHTHTQLAQVLSTKTDVLIWV
jgi:hypothetical protein